jgi:uncharacterized protein (DUF58 family)
MNTGNNLLYMVLALLLAFLVLSGVLSESALRGIQVRRRLPRDLQAERPAPVVLEIRNAQRLAPSFAVVVEDCLGDDVERGAVAGRVFAFRIAAGATETRSYPLHAEGRGALAFAGFRVATRFPFGLFSKALRLDAPGEALVGPAVDAVGVDAERTARARDEGGVGRGLPRPEASGLRAWAAGDAFRHVHWRASARRGALLVRDREREGRAELWVRLATRDAEPGARFERAVRRAASEAAAGLALGLRVGLATDSARIAPQSGAAQRRRLLAFLATVAPAGAPAPRADARAVRRDGAPRGDGRGSPRAVRGRA